MKNNVHKMVTTITLILVTSVPFSLKALAEVEKKHSPISSLLIPDKSASAIRREALAEKNQHIVNEARESLSGTQQALIALQKNDTKAALSLLQDVSKKLAIVLEKNPDMALVPADIDVDILDFEGDAKTVKQAVKQADDLLEHGKVQSARHILAELASEMRITTLSIPLGSFPLAIKNAIDQM